jgi:hypothetical protein
MRHLVSLLSVLLAAACADAGLQPLATDQVRARFPPGGVVDVVEIDAVDRLPLRKAELVAPDGRTTPASYLNAGSPPGVAFNQEFANSPYAGNPAGLGLTAGETQQRVAVLAIVSTASIPLPDPVEYRRDWHAFRIRLAFGDPPDGVETRELAAPEPPPGG